MDPEPTKPTLGARLRTLFHKGNVNHVVVEKDGQRRVDLPVNLVVLAAVLAVWLVAILVAIALLNDYSIRIENSESVPGAAGPPPAPETAAEEPPADSPPAA